MTLIQLTGGKEIQIALTYEQFRDLLQQALAEGKLLELERSDGTIVSINPNSVSYIQNTTRGGPGPAHDQGRARTAAEVPETA